MPQLAEVIQANVTRLAVVGLLQRQKAAFDDRPDDEEPFEDEDRREQLQVQVTAAPDAPAGGGAHQHRLPLPLGRADLRSFYRGLGNRCQTGACLTAT